MLKNIGTWTDTSNGPAQRVSNETLSAWQSIKLPKHSSFLQKDLLSILVHRQHYFIFGVCNRINDPFKEIDDLLILGGETGSTLYGHS